jgi:hypothetical protein
MTDSGIKKVIIKKEDLPGINGDNFSYNIRYRIIQDDKNLSSAWSNFYNLSAATQQVRTNLPYSYSVDTITNNLGQTSKNIRLGWTANPGLKIKNFDVFIARDLIGKMNNGSSLPIGSTSFIIENEDTDIEVGQLVIGNGFATNTTVTSVLGTTVTIDTPTTLSIANGSFHNYYGTKNCYVTSIGGSDKLETGQFTFFGKNSFAAGEVINITGATTPQFNGRFEVMDKNLSSTQFTIQIFKDLTLFLSQNPTFSPVTSTAIVYAYDHYETSSSPLSWVARKNYENNIYIRVQQQGYPKVARKKLELFSTNAIPVT